MWKTYPYLDSSYGIDLNTAEKNENFLAKIDNFVNQKQYVKITLLNWQEIPLKEIQGELTSGSIVKDGTSAVRRTCTLQCSVDGESYTVEDGNMDFAINKKVYIEVGIKNYTDEYPEYPILWFPQGLFFISTFGISSSANSSVNINLQLKDKIAGLDGDVGGVFSATTQLDLLLTQSAEGEEIEEKVLIYEIIKEIVHHIGGELLTNIVIEDVPLRIKSVMKWSGDNPLWMNKQGNASSGIWYEVTTSEPLDSTNWNQYPAGSDVGYIYSDFVYPDELIATPGSTVTSILDTIKTTLGNYEYYYDIYGVFHFREIKNYMNTTQATVATENMSVYDYLIEVTADKSRYTFSDNSNITSISVNPQYENIKNDYVVQGIKKPKGTDLTYTIRYHLAIDQKPQTGNTYKDLVIYKEETTELIKMQFPAHVEALPDVGNFNLIYTTDNSTFYYWTDEGYKEINLIKYYPRESEDGYVTKDWRTEIYLRGMLARNNGTDAAQYFFNLDNYIPNDGGSENLWIDNLYSVIGTDRIDIDFYFEELDAFWPMIYNLETQNFYGLEETNSLVHTAVSEGLYYLDFIDSVNSNFGEFSVANIGRRSDVISSEEYNCLFEPEFPDIVFINVDDENAEDLRQECIQNGQPYTQVRNDLYFGFTVGGYSNSCYEQIKYELFVHTNYQKTLSIMALPAWYLEPNTRVTVNDKSTNTYGDYMVTNITLPLGASAAGMSVIANECFERYF